MNKFNVIGVGCGGANIVNHMYAKESKDVSMAVCDMDASVIKNSKVVNKLQLGNDGLGAGNKLSVAQREAEKKIRAIRSLLDEKSKVIFIVTCLGGGCGTGAAPIIARESRNSGTITIGVATIPFEFEGNAKFMQALDGVHDLIRNTDAVFLLGNQYIIRHHPELPMNMAFAKADELMSSVIKSIIDCLESREATQKPNFLKRLFGKITNHIWGITYIVSRL